MTGKTRLYKAARGLSSGGKESPVDPAVEEKLVLAAHSKT